MRIVDYAAGLMTGVALLIFDELLTFAQFCGPRCLYPYPFIGSYGIYQASYLPFGLIVLSGVLLVSNRKLRDRSQNTPVRA
jgi:hypothetical protein